MARPGATSDSAFGAPTVDGEKKMPLMHGLDELREQGRMTGIEAENGWSAALEDIVDALSKVGFEECKRETTTTAVRADRAAKRAATLDTATRDMLTKAGVPGVDRAQRGIDEHQ